jgi:hypothetical protein
VEHAARAQQLVDGHAHLEGRLADAVAREDDAEVAGTETSVEALLEQP